MPFLAALDSLSRITHKGDAMSQTESEMIGPQVKSQNLAMLFSKDHAFKIPSYQREYAWTEEQVSALCEDLQIFSESDEAYYLLGQLIIAKNQGEDAGNYPFAVVDGQQRLTTLFLLFLAGINLFAKRGQETPLSPESQKTLVALKEIAELRDLQTAQSRLRLKLTDYGQEYLERLNRQESLPDSHVTNTQSNIQLNYDFLFSFLEKQFPKLENLNQFFSRVIYQVYIIQTVLRDIDQALDTFEKINSRGKPLNSADLLKNLLFQHSNSADYEAQSKKWERAVEDVFRVRPNKAASMEYLMKSMLGARLGEGISNKKVYREWKKLFDDGEVTQSQFVTELLDSSKFLASIGSEKSVTNRHLIASRTFNTVQHLPLVLAARKQAPSEIAFKAVTRLIDARIALSLFAEEKSQTFEAMVWPWAHELSKLEKGDVDGVFSSSKSFFGEQETLIDQGGLRFKNLTYESARDRKRILFVLAAVSFELERQAQHTSDGDTFEKYLVRKSGSVGYHLDHILPKSALLADEKLANLVHTPGNLVLLHAKDNIAAGASNPSEKSVDYKSSQLLLTQALAKKEDLTGLNARILQVMQKCHQDGHPTVDSWSSDEIEARTSYLWKTFSNTLRFENIRDSF